MIFVLRRYAHLLLAVLTAIFLIIASVTGVILGGNAIFEQKKSYKVDNFSELTLRQLLVPLSERYDQIVHIEFDPNGFIFFEGIDTDWNEIKGFINSKGELIAPPTKKNNFIKGVTTLHRSLFLHETGRILMGITAFLLIFIVLSGIVLVLEQQQVFRRFFGKVVKENNAQFYHIQLGRWLLIPIFLIAISGAYLSANRFLISEKKQQHNVDFQNFKGSEKEIHFTNFPVFKNIPLTQIKSVTFPLSEDENDVFILKLKDRELVLHPLSGEIMSEIPVSQTQFLALLSLDIHTGQKNILWSIILIISCIAILFFIFSGFSIFLKRKKIAIKNQFSSLEATHIILYGSEMGTTLHFANLVHQQLLNSGQKSFLTTLNGYSYFPKAQHLIIFTSTYGLGDAPSNAKKFKRLFSSFSQNENCKFSVIGFGSVNYPKFCEFAKEVHRLFLKENWAVPFLDFHVVNDKSVTDFCKWIVKWNEKSEILLNENPFFYRLKQEKLVKMKVLSSSETTLNDGIFTMEIQTKEKFSSGDLLAIYPNERERFYSISKIENKIRLVVKLHEFGIGSQFLRSLKKGDFLFAKVIKNQNFYFPKKAKKVVLISNGVGIAPFLGMIAQNKNVPCYLFSGFSFRSENVKKIEKFLQNEKNKEKITNYYISYSKEEPFERITKKLKKETDFLVNILKNNGVIMVCGSVSLAQNVEEILEKGCEEYDNFLFEHYKNNQQFITDCY